MPDRVLEALRRLGRDFDPGRPAARIRGFPERGGLLATSAPAAGARLANSVHALGDYVWTRIRRGQLGKMPAIAGLSVNGSVANGLGPDGQQPYVKLIVEGTILLLFVTIDALARRKRAASGES